MSTLGSVTGPTGMPHLLMDSEALPIFSSRPRLLTEERSPSHLLRERPRTREKHPEGHPLGFLENLIFLCVDRIFHRCERPIRLPKSFHQVGNHLSIHYCFSVGGSGWRLVYEHCHLHVVDFGR